MVIPHLSLHGTLHSTGRMSSSSSAYLFPKGERPHDDLMQSICCRIADQTHFSTQRSSSLTAVSAIRKEQQISVHEACISLKCDKSTKLPPEVLSQPLSGVVPSFYPKVCLLKRFTIYICIILLISS